MGEEWHVVVGMSCNEWVMEWSGAEGIIVQVSLSVHYDCMFGTLFEMG
jgi:hypothetical protein